jgi:hypothetical protein
MLTIIPMTTGKIISRTSPMRKVQMRSRVSETVARKTIAKETAPGNMMTPEQSKAAKMRELTTANPSHLEADAAVWLV